MKRVALATIVTSALLAGPDVSVLVDYDAQDEKMAKTQEKEQIAPAPIAAPLVTAPAPVMKRSCCTNRDSIDLLGGYNFTEDNSVLDDAVTIGIRYNKNIAPNAYIQTGYERVFYGDYKNLNLNNRKNSKSVSDDGDGENGNVSSTSSSGTQLDRFYLNGLYEFCGKTKLTPYLFAGLGYENVRCEAYDLESGGFFDAGAGLKYQLNEDVNLITEARALKKFKNHDLDIVAGLGLGFMFGKSTSENIQTVELNTEIEPKPDVIPSIIPADIPLATVTETEVPNNYDDKNYDNYDVVPIDEINRKNSYHETIQTIEESEPAYYIQIAALFRNSLDTSYFQKLDDQGLNHQIKETTFKGKPVKLLLAGPYSSKAEAKADLSRAKRIEKGAFIKKIDG